MKPPALAAPLTRRALLGRATASVGTAAILLAGCGRSSRHHDAKPPSTGTPSLEVQLLNRSLALKYEAVAAYAAGIPLLSGRPHEAAKHFLDLEISQTGELAGLAKQAGGKPSKPRPTYDLGRPHNAGQVLSLLAELERRQVALMLDAVAQLSVGATRAAIGAVLGSDAQHLALLRDLMGLDPIPGAIFAGTPASAASPPASVPVGEGMLIVDLAAVELLAIAVYGRVLVSPHLSPRARRLARKLLGQEHAHLRALARELRRLDLKLLPAPSGVEAIDGALSNRKVDRKVEDLHSEHDCLDLLLAVESVSEGAYYSALSKLQSPHLLSLAAALLASEGQHEALLGERRMPKNFDQAAPYPYVEGIH
ncbi:MAG: ferritin-like domain-containing protein [Actinomycetota bacterium]|nr:ferritin-like domain-containing protein [Actinomycetota bacterium]